MTMKEISEEEALKIAHDNANVLIRQLKEENEAYLAEHPDEGLELPSDADYEKTHGELVLNFLKTIGTHHTIVPKEI